MDFKKFIKEQEIQNMNFLKLYEAHDNNYFNISQEMGMSRMGALKAVKRALGKIYYALKSANADLSPIELFDAMVKSLGVAPAELFKDLPKEIKADLEAAAKKHLRGDA